MFNILIYVTYENKNIQIINNNNTVAQTSSLPINFRTNLVNNQKNNSLIQPMSLTPIFQNKDRDVPALIKTDSKTAREESVNGEDEESKALAPTEENNKSKENENDNDNAMTTTTKQKTKTKMNMKMTTKKVTKRRLKLTTMTPLLRNQNSMNFSTGLTTIGLASTNANANANANTNTNANATPLAKQKNQNNKQDKSQIVVWYTLPQIVSLITDPNHSKKFQLIVLTHRAFCESKQLLQTLIDRYFVPLPPNLSPAEITHYRQNYLTQVRIRVGAVLIYWLRNHWEEDFANQLELLDIVNGFVKKIKQDPQGQALAINITKLIEKKEISTTISVNVDKRKSEIVGVPRARFESFFCFVFYFIYRFEVTRRRKDVDIVMDVQTVDILTFDVEKAAPCLVQITHESFIQIQPREIFNSIKNKEEAPHVQAMVQRFNDFANWVQREVLSEKRDLKKRVSCVVFFINLAHLLTKMGDFTSGCAVLTGLAANSVYRLKQTESKLTNKQKQIREELKTLYSMNKSYALLRERQKQYLAKPAIPYIGMFKKDLTMLFESPSTKAGGKLLNYSKAKLLGKQIEHMKMFQNNKWNLTCDAMLLRYIRSQLEQPEIEEQQLYKISKRLEP
ncbi:rasGEF domain-containing protein [Reticulomyxa filosa]|uniref:RasGEF domain-containing protein n=1 Tax=Reticulomyxa filosa TaxID=46433 RepID=X6NCL2_RETFI|nr:rasGEF domain-containing protein [Reticulomyxa filosa]|eukprot:ETO23062.1 rasGEF domain-containing protein [Reticulomyxa filosa]